MAADDTLDPKASTSIRPGAAQPDTGLKVQPPGEPGAVFVRECPKCHKLTQTADYSGQTPCAECRAQEPAAAPEVRDPDAPAPAPELVLDHTHEPAVDPAAAAARKA